MSVRWTLLAAWVRWFIRDMELQQPLNVVGFSMGGWIAAEIATVNSTIFKLMVLVGPAGLKPDKGETWDYFVNSGKEAFEQAVHNPDNSPEYAKYYGEDWDPEEADEVEINRKMAARLLWKPYMKSHTLAPLLGAVSTETEVIWGAGTPDNPGQHLHAVPQRDQELQGPDDRRLRPHLRRWKNRPSSPSWS